MSHCKFPEKGSSSNAYRTLLMLWTFAMAIAGSAHAQRDTSITELHRRFMNPNRIEDIWQS
jgi:hypothetical protein